jgi:hypothetical protein
MQMNTKNLLKGAKILASKVFGKGSIYTLSFTKENDGKWYIDFPNWPFDHHNLMMVAGADKLCKELSYDGRHTKVEVMIANSEKEELEMTKTHKYTDVIAIREDYSITGGANYKASSDYREITPKFWLCPVTLFVLGHYPKYLRIRKVEPAN